MKPKKEQINSKKVERFMSVFREEAEKELVIGESVYFDQIEVIEEYGAFLSLVGEENFKIVSSKLATAIKHWNLAKAEQISWAMGEHERAAVREEQRRRATAFRRGLPLPTIGDKDRYLQMIDLIDQFIDELQNPPADDRFSTIVPFMLFTKPSNKTKSKLKQTIDEIVKKYNIEGFSMEIKQLKDKLE
ncbi:MAG: hypothetical protein JXK05_13370 [Campylobacterales bacterium]|nr:hypothetical protein [Campylobacterales bacterium]